MQTRMQSQWLSHRRPSRQSRGSKLILFGCTALRLLNAAAADEVVPAFSLPGGGGGATAVVAASAVNDPADRTNTSSSLLLQSCGADSCSFGTIKNNSSGEGGERGVTSWEECRPGDESDSGVGASECMTSGTVTENNLLPPLDEDEGSEGAFWTPRWSDLEVTVGGDDEEEEEEENDTAEGEVDYGDMEEVEVEAESVDGNDYDMDEATDSDDDGSGEEEEDDDEDDEEDIDEGIPSPPVESETVGALELGLDPAEDLGVAQRYFPHETDSTSKALTKAREYVRTVVRSPTDPYPLAVRDHLCKNLDPHCALWAARNECSTNPRFMSVTCAPLCETCHLLHASTRCQQYDPNNGTDHDVLPGPGSLDRLFERILDDSWMVEHYQIKALSRPFYAKGDGPENADYQLGMWLLELNAFASTDECRRLVELGEMEGYERSADVGDEKEDGTYDDDVNSGRTSHNSWCGDACRADPLAEAVIDRMANVTGIPPENQEHLQLLRYEEGQYYQTHNDYIDYQALRPVGARILTFYLYLNDVEEGGETDFPRLGLRVRPRRGRAVLWPSVLNSHPNHIDARSDHQAMPVIRGVKYGANAWIHQRDYQTVAVETDDMCT